MTRRLFLIVVLSLPFAARGAGAQACNDGLYRRLPSLFQERESVQFGGLVSYGSSFPDLHRRAAGYVERILSGAKPGDLPIEQPTRFDLVVNLKAARALGVWIPHAVLLRADEVIR